MNKYYSFISLSFSSESFINTIQRNVNIQSKKKKKTLQIEVSVNVLDDQKFSFVRVNAV